MRHISLILIILLLFNSCKISDNTKEFNSYPTPVDENLWITYGKNSTSFKLWSPNAEEVTLRLFKKGNDVEAFEIYSLKKSTTGVWHIAVQGDLNGTYYT
ncbi:hypothetical protein [Maribacter dokdonensis]